ncbi:hypothetical protein SAMN02745729_11613 [Marinobacterium iners DSM 11526]|uniref:Uncharacterized protein n=1 Tax=Marinobacterium iners DSM 11526 TaxID=1122198 RepID=A0A1H4GGY8_9GAMM|nr:hypothetical protein SAMN02745729_11613 [Marinobacterium iners DSM 11526]
MDTFATYQASYRAPGITQKRNALGVYSSQYFSNRYQALIERYESKPNISCKGNGWDNTLIESIISRLKVSI